MEFGNLEKENCLKRHVSKLGWKKEKKSTMRMNIAVQVETELTDTD